MYNNENKQKVDLYTIGYTYAQVNSDTEHISNMRSLEAESGERNIEAK